MEQRNLENARALWLRQAQFCTVNPLPIQSIYVILFLLDRITSCPISVDKFQKIRKMLAHMKYLGLVFRALGGCVRLRWCSRN